MNQAEAIREIIHIYKNCDTSNKGDRKFARAEFGKVIEQFLEDNSYSELAQAVSVVNEGLLNEGD